MFANLSRALAAAGASFADVVKLNYYLTDISLLPRSATTNVSTPGQDLSCQPWGRVPPRRCAAWPSPGRR
ncbi:MAG: hypothetical protein ACRD0H_25745 [Actinomycetes bacterium]